MKCPHAIATIGMVTLIAGSSQGENYDSRAQAPPHVFTWEDAYDYVDIWGRRMPTSTEGF